MSEEKDIKVADLHKGGCFGHQKGLGLYKDFGRNSEIGLIAEKMG